MGGGTEPVHTAGREAVQLVELGPAEEPALRAAAARDGHRVIAATHVLKRGDEVVGYASLGRQQLFFAWLDSRKLSVFESFRAWHQAEQLAAGKGLCLAVSPDSPFIPFVERMGYERLGPAVLFLKRS
jgi:hypothetical protein